MEKNYSSLYTKTHPKEEHCCSIKLGKHGYRGKNSKRRRRKKNLSYKATKNIGCARRSSFDFGKYLARGMEGREKVSDRCCCNQTNSMQKHCMIICRQLCTYNAPASARSYIINHQNTCQYRKKLNEICYTRVSKPHKAYSQEVIWCSSSYIWFSSSGGRFKLLCQN